MNDDTKIKELRKKGYGYKRIAKELSMTPSAVRHACIRIEEEQLLGGYCKNCNKEMMSIKGKKKKVFCSDQCRWQWWNKKRAGKHHGTN